MSQKENVDATWEDMDWGQFEPSRAVAKAVPVESAPPPPPAHAPVTPPPPPAAVNAQAVAAEQRQQSELERVSMEAELVRMKAELVEQQRQLAAARQVQVAEMPRTSPLSQEPSAIAPSARAEGTGAAFVFNPQTLATLTLVSEGGREAQVTVKDAFAVGRNKGNDLVIRDLHVSSQHARFTLRQDGVFEITDLGSSGGTFVNGQRIERCALKSGDKIEFATVAATFRYVAGDRLDPADEFEGTLVHSKADAVQRLAAVSQAPMHGMLSVLALDEQSRVVPVGSQITIGRASGNDVIIAQEHVSGRHARLAGNGSNGFELFDLGSSCGTFVNDVKGTHWILQSGDRVRFGVVDCVFMIIGPDGQAQKAPQAPLRMPALPRVEDSGVAPLPEPKPALPGRALPRVSN